ncbi:hypothetical protein ADH76_18085 [Enterocloster clostridioformis]|nr:hypothetical protein ADH76_18085 [Enterocloster clostridioformis]
MAKEVPPLLIFIGFLTSALYITQSGKFLSAKAGLRYLITYGLQTLAITMVVTSIVIPCIVSDYCIGRKKD